MFKPGQLVQSVKYGDYYVVESNRITFSECRPLSRKFWFHENMLMEHDRIQLIGNNYRSKK